MAIVPKPLQDFYQIVKRDYWSWWMRPQFLKKGPQSDTLFAGPWIGEFGWELLNWQGFVRKVSKDYSKVIVCCRQGNEGLYRDFATEFVYHSIRGTAECNTAHDIENPSELKRINDLIPASADVLKPVGFLSLDKQEFAKFGTPDPEKQYDVVFHPRGRTFGTVRNWDKDNWEKLIVLLSQKGYRIACIGLTNATLDIDPLLAFDDFRDVSLDETLDLFASSKLVVGPSSGPMHLASLCGTPHLVWTDTKGHARGRTNRDKYEWWWNPHKTQAIVFDKEGFDPSVDSIYRAIVNTLSV
ncbi:MAG: hypothetical protein OCD01_11420 [Fibrobacterales bacterium]